MLTLEILVLILLTLINGVLAMSELAMISSRRSRLEHLAREGGRGAKAALNLLDDPSRFLSTVQIGITLVGIVAGAFSGATLGQRLGLWLNRFEWIHPHGIAAGIGAMVLFITYLSLIVGELVPKRIALAQPERIASAVSIPMTLLSLLASPAVWVLHASTERILHLLGLPKNRESTITEDEVKSLIAEGTQSGVFVPQEQAMIEGVLRLADRSVRVIMTPRPRIVWLDVASDRNTILEVMETNRYSRMLVCNGDVDHPVGVLHTKDLLPAALRCEEVPLSALMKPVLYIPEGLPVLRLLNRFKREKAHLAVVVDEHGSTEGLVTLTDVIEAIAGDLPEPGEEEGPRIVQRDAGSWLVDGETPTDEVEQVTGISMGKDVKMMAGFMLTHLGKIPVEGANFVYGDSRFEVVDMDGNRIDKVLVEYITETFEEDGPIFP